MDGLERLLALEDIQLLRTKYCRFIDTKQFDRLTEIMTPDCGLDLREASAPLGIESPPVFGRDNIIAQLNGFGDVDRLLHIVSLPEIEFQGDTATGIWRQETYVKNAKPDLPGCGIAYATCYDQYRRTEDGWRIVHIRVTLDMIM